MRYRVMAGQSIWHTKDERYYSPGDEVSLDHLPSESVQYLLDQGVMEEVKESAKSKVLSLSKDTAKLESREEVS